MSDATLVALTILGGVFLLMSITIAKDGVDAAIRMWGVMGALTGVAFGAITSYYFTKDAANEQLNALNSEKKRIEALLASVSREAKEARELVVPVYAGLKGDQSTPYGYPGQINYAKGLSSDEQRTLIEAFTEATSKLDNIDALNQAYEASNLGPEGKSN